VLEDLRGGDPKVLAQALRGLVVAANQNPLLSRVFTTFSATNPSVFLDIDREKAQILGVPLSAVFQALQASLGGFYVNDVNLFGRRWQVQVQAEADDRDKVDDIYRINVRNNEGRMIPLRSLVEVRVVVGPPALIRYNNVRAVTVLGSPAPGVFVGTSPEGDGTGCGQDSSGGLRRRVDRYIIPGKARRRPNHDDPRLCVAVRQFIFGWPL
jgi:multidrug efflux pump subunit AcrB